MDSVTIDFHGVKLVVTGTFTKGESGRMYMENGDPGYPPEPASFEWETIETQKGEDVTAIFEMLINNPKIDVGEEIEKACIDKMN